MRMTGPTRAPLLLVALALLAGACVSSEPPPADVAQPVVPAVTTMPAVPPEPVTEDVVEAVEAYWQQRDAAFAGSADAGIAFVVAHNHPLLPYTVEQCREAWFDGDVPVGFAERTALLEGSIESDPGWSMATGPIAGRELGSGLFRMVVAFTYEGDGLRVADRVATVHLQVDGGDVRQFLLCEDVEVTVVTPPAAEAAPSATTPATTPTTPPTTQPTTIPPAPVTLPPITATPSPVDPGDGGGDGDGDGPPATPPPTGNRPPGSGIDFCDEGDPGAQPIAGDYFLCPDTDIDNTTGEDGGSSEP